MRIEDVGNAGTKEIYIVGTGPSLRVFDLSFLRDKVTIGLNQAWRHFEPTFSITVHPELVLDYEKEKSGVKTTRWIVKRKPPMAKLTFEDPNYIVFDTSYELTAVTTRPNSTLYLGEGVQTCAMDLAARWSATHIILVGCDGGSLDGDFHAHDQHVRWLGMKPDDQYALYRESTAEVRKELSWLGVSVFSMTPFIGVNHAKEDYARLKKALGLGTLPPPADTSPYIRDPKTIRVKKKKE